MHVRTAVFSNQSDWSVFEMYHDALLKIGQKRKSTAARIAPNTHHEFMHVRTAAFSNQFDWSVFEIYHDAHLKICKKVKAVKVTQIAPNIPHAFLHVRTAVALSTPVFCAQSDSGAENVD